MKIINKNIKTGSVLFWIMHTLMYMHYAYTNVHAFISTIDIHGYMSQQGSPYMIASPARNSK